MPKGHKDLPDTSAVCVANATRQPMRGRPMQTADIQLIHAWGIITFLRDSAGRVYSAIYGRNVLMYDPDSAMANAVYDLRSRCSMLVRHSDASVPHRGRGISAARRLSRSERLAVSPRYLASALRCTENLLAPNHTHLR